MDYYENALIIFQDMGDKRAVGSLLGDLGNPYHALGDFHRASDFYQHSYIIHHELGDQRGEAADLGILGRVYTVFGRIFEAIDYLERAIRLAAQIGDRQSQAHHSWNLGKLFAKQGDRQRAATLMQVLIENERELNHPAAETDAAYVTLILDGRGDQL